MIPELFQSYEESAEEAKEEVSLSSTSRQESGNSWTLTRPRKHGQKGNLILKSTNILKKGTHRIFLKNRKETYYKQYLWE